MVLKSPMHAEEFDVTVKKPGTCVRQVNRVNTPTDTVEEHFKETISLPFLDHLLQEMETRLTDLHKYATLGFIMVPSDSQIKEYRRFVFLLLR